MTPLFFREYTLIHAITYRYSDGFEIFWEYIGRYIPLHIITCYYMPIHQLEPLGC